MNHNFLEKITRLEAFALGLLNLLFISLFEKPFAVAHLQLLSEALPVDFSLYPSFHAVDECILEIALCEGETLQLLECFDLLLPLPSLLCEYLVL